MYQNNVKLFVAAATAATNTQADNCLPQREKLCAPAHNRAVTSVTAPVVAEFVQ